jgi:uncharacterized membrane protein YciS (DUF1049 family)
VRNALIVLVVVALVIVALGAFNNDLLFDVDMVVGTWTAVSLFWVAVVIAGVVLVTGSAAAFFARSSAVTGRRKLEKELKGTYERLRDAEAKLPVPAPPQTAVAEVTPGEQTAVTGVVAASPADETSPAAEAIPEAGTVVDAAAPEAETGVVSAPPEAETGVISAPPEAGTVVAVEAAPADVVDASPPAAS